MPDDEWVRVRTGVGQIDGEWHVVRAIRDELFISDAIYPTEAAADAAARAAAAKTHTDAAAAGFSIHRTVDTN